MRWSVALSLLLLAAPAALSTPSGTETRASAADDGADVQVIVAEDPEDRREPRSSKPRGPPPGEAKEDHGAPENRSRPIGHGPVLPPPPPGNGTLPSRTDPDLSVRLDLPDTANAAEPILVTVLVATANGTVARNATVTVEFDPNYQPLPAWQHDEWRIVNVGADPATMRRSITFAIDEVDGDASFYFHVAAPVEAANRTTAWRAEFAAGGGTAATSRDVLVLGAAEPDPANVPRQLLVLVGYAATLTAAPGTP